MIVVADTSPLNYLIQIGAVHLLPLLYTKILIPKAVAGELSHPSAAPSVRRWISSPPQWLELHTAKQLHHPALAYLDAGEQEAIELALALNISTLLIDERRGRQKAREFNLVARGTLGVLEQGARLGKVNLQTALHKLDGTNFRISSALRNSVVRSTAI